MRHIIAPKEKAYSPVPSFENHSRFLAVVIVFTHPFIAFLCLKLAEVLSMFTSFVFHSLGLIYGDASSLGKFKFEEISESAHLYPAFLIFILLFVSYLFATFRAFRIKTFWLNFFISLTLLLIGVLIFMPGSLNLIMDQL